ncbi:hypothetical protein [Christiangramia sp. SM2212]|uniref:Phosphoribosyltransferase domain-containing protein n=1 Tax=Christiangramia sediminicola TaxID=3073267 RepID=A0ABU1ES41_9FLAO|nr:hypothetical protein [Christiangramia sp. SM2212]MDR5591213.1 hypothetical protein [Christiangramia sp. SM2212]
MRFEFECGVLLNYSPRGTSDRAKNSRILKGRLKNANPKTINDVCRVLNNNENSEVLRIFFENNQCLVPVPRSAPLLRNALWPTLRIAELFVQNGIGSSVSTMVNRIDPVPKSSQFYSAEDRPTISTHLRSLRVNPPPPDTNNFILIDDILTLGRTTTACALKIKEILPNANIKIFSLMRTIGRQDDIDLLLNPRTDYIYYNSETGKSWIPNLDV